MPSQRVFRIALICVGFKALLLLSAWLMATRVSPNASPCQWDCLYYQGIASTGYEPFVQDKHTNLAFFPAFPLLVKGLSFITGLSFGWTGIFLNLALFALIIILLLKWCEAVAFPYPALVALLFSVDRFTLWSHIPYTEALFTSTLLGFFLLARHPRGQRFSGQLLLAVIAGYATAIRLVGVSFLTGLGLSRIKEYLRRPHRGALIFLIGLWGVIAFFSYLKLSQGSFTLSLQATAQWRRHFSFEGFFESAIFLLRAAYFPTIITLIGGAWLLARPPAWLRISVLERWTFCVLIFVPMASTITSSLTRYMSIVFVGHLAWALLLLRYKHWAWRLLWLIVLIVESGQQLHLTAKFFRGEFFNWAA